MLKHLKASNKPLFVMEDVTRISGLGSAIMEYFEELGNTTSDLTIFGLPDQFIGQGTLDEIQADFKLDPQTILSNISRKLKE
jgi:1-deoxy-D-xylulose-5-phosphate synthase